jgi:glycosyltransferase involved in cell wall biosynthesis
MSTGLRRRSRAGRSTSRRTGSRETRVLLVTQVVAAYRIPLYAKLAELAIFDFLVVHGVDKRDQGRTVAGADESLPFRQVCVDNFETNLGGLTLRWQRGALRAARAFRPDVIIVSGEVGNASSWLICLWARLSGRRLLVWTSAWEPQRPGSPAWHVKRLLIWIYVRVPHLVLTYGTRAKATLSATGMPDSRIIVCQNGLEVDDLLARQGEIRDAAIKRRGAEGVGSRVLFLFVGRLTRGKNADLLLSAFRDLPERVDSVLWVVGDGPELDELRAHASTAGLDNVRFWGRIVDDVESWFAAADCVVLPGQGGLAINRQ